MTLTTIAPARGLVRGPQRDPRWARPLFLALLAATTAAYLWGLSRNQWGNDFYAAAVQAGTRSWKAFFFGSFDASNFITVDKTPASLWVMEISGRVFGFSSWSLLAPQALEGVVSVAVLYATVKRWFGPGAGLLAGAVLAITPVAALMFRFDNPDALLALLATAAAYAVTRALEQEEGATRWLLVAGLLLGFGFLAKMLAAFLVVPGFALAYLWAGPSRLSRRVGGVLWSGLGIAAGGGWWVAIAQFTPASWRPYFGGSTDNSVLQLAIGYNGLGRLDGTERAGMAGHPGGGHGQAGQGPAADGAASGAHALAGHGGFGGSTGITRLFGPQFGGQVGWLLPAALVAGVALLWLSRRAPRTDRTRAFALLWGGWLVVSGLTFSYMQGIIHPYYTLALAPAIGALVGAGGWALARAGRAGRLLGAVTVAVTGWWEFELLARSPAWLPWLRWSIAAAAAAAAVALLAAGRRGRAPGLRPLAFAPLGITLVASLAGPLAYSIKTINSTHAGGMPTAGPAVAGAFRGFGVAGRNGSAGLPLPPGLGASGPAAHGAGGLARPGGFAGGMRVSPALLALVTSGASKYRWIAATVGSMEAAPIELASGGDPVLAIGGFSGSDPAPTLRQFEAMVAAHQVHYYIARAPGGLARRAGAASRGGAASPAAAAGPGALAGRRGGLGGLGWFGGGADSSAIASWVTAHFTAQTVGGATVYNLTTPPHPPAGREQGKH